MDCLQIFGIFKILHNDQNFLLIRFLKISFWELHHREILIPVKDLPLYWYHLFFYNKHRVQLLQQC